MLINELNGNYFAKVHRANKAVVGGTAGPAGPLFWPKMVLAGPFFWHIMIFLYFLPGHFFG